jgi:hypothetical protein
VNNFKIAFQRFIKNKNTVTVLGVFVIILVLYLGYRYQINKMVSPVTGIPVAAETIQPRTKITSDMITYVDIAPIVLQDNVIRSSGQIVGNYSAPSTVIPEGSLFYKGVVVSESELPDSAFVKLEEGQVPYNFPVTMDSTYGNSIYPNNYIDIYMKAYNEDNTLMVGKLFENIKVLAVKDSSGQNVFENSEESRTPAYLIFGLNNENNILLRKASYMSNFSVELFPVPHGTNVSTEAGETYVSSQTLKDFINANTVPNDDINDNTTDKKADNASDKNTTKKES